MAIQQEISADLNNSKIGQTLKVLVDREEQDYFIARTEYDSPEVDQEVLIDNNPGIQTGNFYQVRITGAEPFDLKGELA